MTEFAVSRALAGIGGGGMSALSSIIVTDVIPLRLRGMFQGYANLVYGTGQFLGPIIGSICITLSEKSGWRWMFGLQVPLVLCTSFMVFKNVHEFRTNSDELMKCRFNRKNLRRIDLPGSALLACFIVSILTLFSPTSKLQVRISLVGAFVSLLAFYLVEKFVVEERIIPPAAFQGLLRVAALVALFGTMAVYSLNFIIPLYIQIVHDFSSLQVGIFNAFGVFASALGSLIAGWCLKEKKHTRTDVVVRKAVTVSIASCLALCAGTFICMFLMRTLKPTLLRKDINYVKMAFLALGFTLESVGYGSFLVSLLVLVVGQVGVSHQATVTGMNYMFRSMGSVSGVGISLGVYNMILYKELYHYFIVKGRANGKEILEKLFNNSFYIRSGLPSLYVHKVLKIYRSSLGDSSMMVFMMGCAALILSLLMRLYKICPGRRASIV